jgi:serine/threonine protein kinase
MDHLTEDPDYYVKLAKMEEGHHRVENPAAEVDVTSGVDVRERWLSPIPGDSRQVSAYGSGPNRFLSTASINRKRRSYITDLSKAVKGALYRLDAVGTITLPRLEADGAWQEIAHLGKGAFGSVSIWRHIGTGITVVVKTQQQGTPFDVSIREIQGSLSCAHPNISSLIDYWALGGYALDNPVEFSAAEQEAVAQKERFAGSTLESMNDRECGSPFRGKRLIPAITVYPALQDVVPTASVWSGAEYGKNVKVPQRGMADPNCDAPKMHKIITAAQGSRRIEPISLSLGSGSQTKLEKKLTSYQCRSSRDVAEGKRLVAPLWEQALVTLTDAHTLTQLAGALAYMESRKLVHRDFRDANIMLQHFGSEVVPAVIDFGMCQFTWEQRSTFGPVFVLPPEVLITATRQEMNGGPEDSGDAMKDRSTPNAKASSKTDSWEFGLFMYQFFAGQQQFYPYTGSRFAAKVIFREIHNPTKGTRISSIAEKVAATAFKHLGGAVEDVKRKYPQDNNGFWAFSELLHRRWATRMFKTKKFAAIIRSLGRLTNEDGQTLWASSDAEKFIQEAQSYARTAPSVDSKGGKYELGEKLIDLIAAHRGGAGLNLDDAYVVDQFLIPTIAAYTNQEFIPYKWVIPTVYQKLYTECTRVDIKTRVLPSQIFASAVKTERQMLDRLAKRESVWGATSRCSMQELAKKGIVADDLSLSALARYGKERLAEFEQQQVAAVKDEAAESVRQPKSRKAPPRKAPPRKVRRPYGQGRDRSSASLAVEDMTPTVRSSNPSRIPPAWRPMHGTVVDAGNYARMLAERHKTVGFEMRTSSRGVRTSRATRQPNPRFDWGGIPAKVRREVIARVAEHKKRVAQRAKERGMPRAEFERRWTENEYKYFQRELQEYQQTRHERRAPRRQARWAKAAKEGRANYFSVPILLTIHDFDLRLPSIFERQRGRPAGVDERLYVVRYAEVVDQRDIGGISRTRTGQLIRKGEIAGKAATGTEVVVPGARAPYFVVEDVALGTTSVYSFSSKFGDVASMTPSQLRNIRERGYKLTASECAELSEPSQKAMCELVENRYDARVRVLQEPRWEGFVIEVDKLVNVFDFVNYVDALVVSFDRQRPVEKVWPTDETWRMAKLWPSGAKNRVERAPQVVVRIDEPPAVKRPDILSFGTLERRPQYAAIPYDEDRFIKKKFASAQFIPRFVAGRRDPHVIDPEGAEQDRTVGYENVLDVREISRTLGSVLKGWGMKRLPSGWEIDPESLEEGRWSNTRTFVFKREDGRWVVRIKDDALGETPYEGARWVVDVLPMEENPSEPGTLRIDTSRKAYFPEPPLTGDGAPIAYLHFVPSPFLGLVQIPVYDYFVNAMEVALLAMDEKQTKRGRRANPATDWILPAAYSLTSAVALGASLIDLRRALKK